MKRFGYIPGVRGVGIRMGGMRMDGGGVGTERGEKEKKKRKNKKGEGDVCAKNRKI